MGETQRLRKSPDKSRTPPPGASEPAAPVGAGATRAPAWAGGAVGAPFALGGGAVQRKVAIGASNDAYERQADHVANRVVGGGTVPPGSISPIAPASVSSVGQRQAKPEEKKKEEKPAPVQRETKPEDTKKDPKAAGEQLQRQAKPEEKKKDEKPAAAPVQKQAKPEEKKKDEKPAAAPVQKQAKPEEKKKDEKPAAAPVQKQAKPEEKKKDEKPAAAPVQKQTKPEEKKKDEKPAAAPVQKQAKPDEKKKNEKPAAVPVQKQTKPEEKKKDEKPAAAPVQKQAKPDEKKKDEKPAAAPVQKQSKPEEKKKDEKPTAAPVQRAVRPEDKKKEEVPGTLPVQRAEVEEKTKDDGGSVQASRAGASAPATPSMESVASNAIASKGPGEPLQSATRGTLESRMGTDLSDVRVHNDSAAHEAANSLNARAFTHQNDIWLGRGESQSDTRLMAHEATHVVQQTGSVHRQLVQKADGAGATPPPAAPAAAGGTNVLSTPAGDIDVVAKKMLLPELKIPEFKHKFLKSAGFVTVQKGGTERPSGSEDQRTIWKEQLGKTVETATTEKLKKVPGVRTQKPGDPHLLDDSSDSPNKVYFFSLGGSENNLIGTPAELKSEFVIPRWGPEGKPRPLDVDHKQELQLGGKNEIGNMHLLDASANRASGSRISRQVLNTIDAAVKPHIGKDKQWKEPPKAKDLRSEYEITYKVISPDKSLDPPDTDARWDKEDIEGVDKPLSKLKPLNAAEVVSKGLLGSPTTLVVYPLSAGGKKKEIKKWDVKNPSIKLDTKAYGFKGLHDASISYEPGKGGSIKGIVFRKEKGKPKPEEKEVELPLKEVGGIPFTVTMDKGGLLQSMRFAELKMFSPIEFKEVEFEEARGVVARGKLMPSIPLFKKLDIDVIAEGDDFKLSKTFLKDDFNLPGPIKVPEARLTLAIGTASGLSAEGEVNFEIERLGKGKLSAGVSTAGGLELTGSFDFDTKLFDPANIHVEYKDNKFSGGGKIGIKPGKVRGIKSATIEASFAEGAIDAKGSIVPDIPAVEQADLSMHYDEKSGLTIAGDLQLKKDIPGIAGGSIHAEVNKKEDKYVVKASGEATPKIPGINSKLVVSYDDGAFDATVTAAYEKGMLKGSVTVGATNRPVDDSGKPAEAPPAKSDKITVYGGGSVTLKLAPWLQATAAIKFKPNGEVEVTGKIGLPSALNIFDEKKVEKNIFKIALDIPILGFSVLGHNVGIFLEIGGGLDLNAGIGPGQLQEAELSVTYNPAHEEDTQVHGHSALHIPAHAGLRLFVSAALGAGIPLVDAKAGIELGGSLGIEGALHAAVDVDWSPKKGLVLDANAEVYAEPKFKFDITGFVLVELDLLFTTKTLYEKKWQLAAVEYGSGLRLGMKMPVHYEEGKPFNVSLSDIQFEVPNIDAMATIKGLFNKII